MRVGSVIGGIGVRVAHGLWNRLFSPPERRDPGPQSGGGVQTAFMQVGEAMAAFSRAASCSSLICSGRRPG